MATFTKRKLESSTNGLSILVVGTTTADASTIHTAHATAQDEVYLYCVNTHTAAVVLTIEFGGTAAKDLIKQTIAVAPSGMVLVVPGFPLTGSVVVKAFCPTTNVVGIYGFVNRIA